MSIIVEETGNQWRKEESEHEENNDEVDDENVTIVSENEDDDTNVEKYHYLDAFCQLEMEEDSLVS